MKSVKGRAAVAPAERAVGPIAGGSTGCSDGSTAGDEMRGTVGLGAEMASGENFNPTNCGRNWQKETPTESVERS